MKKIISLILILAVALTMFVGCKDNGGVDPANNSESDISSDIDPIDNDVSDFSKDDESDIDPVDNSEPDSTKDDAEYVRGAWIDGDYISNYLNITFKEPSANWLIATDEDIATLMGLESVEEFEAEMKKVKTIYEFLLKDTNGSNIQLMCEDLSKTLGAGGVDGKQYLKIVEAQFVQVNSEFSVLETSTRTIAGEVYDCLSVEVNSTENLYQKYFARRQGDYMVVFIVTYRAEAEATVNELLDSMQPIV